MCTELSTRLRATKVAAARHRGMPAGTDGARIILRGARRLARRVKGTANTGIVLLHWVKGAQCLQFSNSNTAGDRRKSNVRWMRDVQKVMHCSTLSERAFQRGRESPEVLALCQLCEFGHDMDHPPDAS